MMEATPIFAILNRLLVWKIAKNFAHCDLDLVLTKYYKERLNFLLKKGDAHMNEDKSTKPTVLNISSLPVLFN